MNGLKERLKYFSDMKSQERATWLTIENIAGRVIHTVERVFFVFQGQIDDSHGPLQLTFADTSSMLFDVAENGERLKIKDEKWRDPFTLPLSEENRCFIEECGKWTVYDMSEQNPYSTIIGKKIQTLQPIWNEFHTLAGVRFEIGHHSLSFCVGYDEAFVFWGEQNTDLLRMGFTYSDTL